MSEPDDDWEGEYEGSALGCYECQGGWRHGCMDDLCRGSNEPEDCDAAYPCRNCNPEGRFSF